MAETAQDFGEHRRTYDLFLRVATLGTLHIAGVLVALVIATLQGAPFVGVLGMIAITLAAAYGMVRPGRGDPRPALAVVVVLFLVMGVLS